MSKLPLFMYKSVQAGGMYLSCLLPAPAKGHAPLCVTETTLSFRYFLNFAMDVLMESICLIFDFCSKKAFRNDF